jgi:hypothetical protein
MRARLIFLNPRPIQTPFPSVVPATVEASDGPSPIGSVDGIAVFTHDS